jgi:YD repeat-containing protein
MTLEGLERWNQDVDRRGYEKVVRDLENRPIQAWSKDGTEYEWEYDEDGNLCASSRS